MYISVYIYIYTYIYIYIIIPPLDKKPPLGGDKYCLLSI